MRKLSNVVAIVMVFFLAVFGGYWLHETISPNTLKKLEKAVPKPIITISPSLEITPTPSIPGAKDVAGSKIPKIKTPETKTTAETHTNSATIGKVTKKFKYTPDAYSVMGGKEAYPNEIVYGVLQNQELGHLSSHVETPSVSYTSQGKEIRPGVYLVTPADIKLTENTSINIDFSIRYPIVTNEQFEFMRDKKDYRFVYGLIAGVVGHEEMHYQVLRRYTDEITAILNNPINTNLEIEANTPAEFQQQVNDIMSRTVEQRLAAAKKRHDAGQADIDNPANGSQITFNFKEPAQDGVVPPAIVSQFKGKGTFNFELPEGSVPRPPVPQVNFN